MIHILRQIIISVTVASIFSAVMLAFVKDGALRETIRITTGMLMILALFSPLAALKLPRLTDTVSARNIQNSTEQAVKSNEALQKSTVGGAISNYIQSQALNLGVSCTITTEIAKDKNNQLVIDSICISYDKKSVKTDALKKLSQQIFEECGIPKEKQSFIGR